MSLIRKIKLRKQRRAVRVRHRIKTENNLPRVSVFKSLKHIYAQIIDDNAHTTITSCSSLDLENAAGDKKAIALLVGKELAKKAQEKGIEAVVFDRGSFLYHGRVKELAQGLRDGGLKV
jgi:large subunit ribosomal protein L18